MDFPSKLPSPTRKEHMKECAHQTGLFGWGCDVSIPVDTIGLNGLLLNNRSKVPTHALVVNPNVLTNPTRLQCNTLVFGDRRRCSHYKTSRF